MTRHALCFSIQGSVLYFGKCSGKEREDKLHLEFKPEIERAQRVGPKTRSTRGDSNIADGARNNPRIIVWRLRDWKQEEGIPREKLEEPNQRVCLSMKILQQKLLKSGIIT